MDQAAALPASLQSGLNALLAELIPMVPGRLGCAALYGGLAKGKAPSPTSDVNLLLVTAGPALAALSALAPILSRGRRSLGVNPLVASPVDLDAMARYFPLKYEDIRRHHRVLLGADPFGARVPSPEELRRDAQASLSNLSLRLKRTFVERASDPGLHLSSLEDLLPGALLAFEAALDTASPASVQHREDILSAAAAKAGTLPEPLLALLALKKGGEPAGNVDLAALHGELLATVEGLREALGAK